MDRDRIRADLGPDVISVVSRSGAVTLDGTVVDAAQIDKVAEIAGGVPGVTSAANRLTVRKPFGGQ
ncbi:BON domain-containing protein [Paraburkholderia mimosarum]|uniref:BON domain-containing protein n=1 Tax=Paraburkholderia mimosarum TaxID=312026 RepID=UPI000407CC3D|nr:BON domain-containing protein [Paraburkholderia mimosarum]